MRLQERIDLELKLAASQMVPADDVGAHVPEDAVQEDPRDLFTRVRGDADEDGEMVQAVLEGVVRDGFVGIALEVRADVLARAAEAEGYCRFGDRGAEEVVGEDDAAVV